jgi:hypothetical protein
MTNKNERVRIQLTEEQRKQIKDAGGKDIEALELTVQELEARIAPLIFKY